MNCVEYGDDLVVCFTGPTEVLREESAGVRWCFVCRERVEFTDRLWRETAPSYYDPQWSRKCPSGHLDGDLFPGWTREAS